MREERVATDRAAAPETAQFAADVQYYLSLTPRQLPSRYLYNPLGSALFDAICRLPWYRITAAELRLLAAHGREIVTAMPLSRIIELGPGNGEKLLTLLDAGGLEQRGLEVHLVDISAAALDLAARALTGVDSIRFFAHQATYEAGLAAATSRRGRGRSLALFLGSNIGNFDAPGADAFLRNIRASLCTGDAFLIGADLVKPRRELLLAYDDPLGVTAAFNRNLLVRINDELGGNFDVDRFAHRAVWNDADSRVEMHLVSSAEQSVTVADAGLSFDMAAGESIWTESSYKYEPGEISSMLQRTGFRPMHQWIDAADRFALTLVEAR